MSFITLLSIISAFEAAIIAYLFCVVRKLLRKDKGVDITMQDTAQNEIVEAKEASHSTPQAERLFINDNDQTFIDRLTDIIYSEMEHGKVEVETIAGKMFISRSQLNRKVNSLTGMSTSNYSIQLRLNRACELLKSDTNTPINEIALHCGFDDPAYFTRIFKKRIGVSPSSYRNETENQDA